MLVSRREFDPRPDLASIFDTRGSASIVFGPFLRGGNSTNPVKESERLVKAFMSFRVLCSSCHLYTARI